MNQFFQQFDSSAIDAKLGTTYWSPIDIAQVGGWMLRAAAFKGEYHWHSHEHDEFFYVYSGTITIETEKGPIVLSQGQGAVVSRGERHKPSAQERAVVFMFDPVDVDLTGKK